jgi:hypothetical protein
LIFNRKKDLKVYRKISLSKSSILKNIKVELKNIVDEGAGVRKYKGGNEFA